MQQKFCYITCHSFRTQYSFLISTVDDTFDDYLNSTYLIQYQVINVQVPFLFKLAVDWLSSVTSSGASLTSFTEANSILLAFFVSPAAVLIGYGIARAGASACNGILHEVIVYYFNEEFHRFIIICTLKKNCKLFYLSLLISVYFFLHLCHIFFS